MEVGKEIRVDFSLAPGAQTQTITVTEQLPLIETTNARSRRNAQQSDDQRHSLKWKKFRKPPHVKPGVTLYPGGGSKTQSTDGIRAEDQVYVIEGLNTPSHTLVITWLIR